MVVLSSLAVTSAPLVCDNSAIKHIRVHYSVRYFTNAVSHQSHHALITDTTVVKDSDIYIYSYVYELLAITIRQWILVLSGIVV